MSSEPLTDIEETVEEVRECAKRVQESSRDERRAYARKRVVGWSLTFGWAFFMLAAGMSLSERYSGWVFFGSAMAGLALMILRHWMIGKRAQAVYERLCLQPLFDTLGDWVTYHPKQGISAADMRAVWRGEELLGLMDDKGTLRPESRFETIDAGAATEMFGQHLVTGELLGEHFENAQVSFYRVSHGTVQPGHTRTVHSRSIRSAFVLELAAKAPTPIFVTPNLATLAEGIAKTVPFLATLALQMGEREGNEIGFPEDKAFEKAFFVYTEDEALAQDVLNDEVRGMLLELAPYFGHQFPALCIVGNKLLFLEADAHKLFTQQHPDRIDLPPLAENWLMLLCEVVMLTKALNKALSSS